ncbi:MAG: sugar ABC transporter permease [Ruminococcaceae bacterium]|nr:sugar ABC transporter permease [Oscillospiraceae bacterium]
MTGAAAREVIIRKKPLGQRLKEGGISYVFVLPYFILFCLFTVAPVVISLLLGFTEFNMLNFPRWIGMDNYIRMFLDDEVFILAIRNTFLLAVITGPVSYMLSFLLAWLINDLRPWLRSIVTIIFYAPSLVGNVMMIWQIFFSNDAYGYANAWLLELGLIDAPIRWFYNTEYMMPLVIVVLLWSSLGTSFLAFIAGLQNISRSYYEAGAIDGIKNRWQELWFITLPTMRPMLMFGAVMTISSAFGIGSNLNGLVGFPSTDYATHTIVNHMEDYGGQRYEMGYASAIAAVLFIVMILTNHLIKKLLAKVGE